MGATVDVRGKKMVMDSEYLDAGNVGVAGLLGERMGGSAGRVVCP